MTIVEEEDAEDAQKIRESMLDAWDEAARKAGVEVARPKPEATGKDKADKP